jgi:hypothetical protein
VVKKTAKSCGQEKRWRRSLWSRKSQKNDREK